MTRLGNLRPLSPAPSRCACSRTTPGASGFDGARFIADGRGECVPSEGGERADLLSLEEELRGLGVHEILSLKLP